MQHSPDVANLQITQNKRKSCCKNTERGCSARKGEEWCSCLHHGTETLSQCRPPTALCSKEGTFAQHCLQTSVLLHPDSLEKSDQQHISNVVPDASKHAMSTEEAHVSLHT